MRHATFSLAGILLLITALLLWASPTGFAPDCVALAIICFGVAFWPHVNKS